MGPFDLIGLPLEVAKAAVEKGDKRPVTVETRPPRLPAGRGRQRVLSVRQSDGDKVILVHAAEYNE